MDEALALLRLQLEWGADEAIEDGLPDRSPRRAAARAPVLPAAAPVAPVAGGMAGRAEATAASCADLESLRAALAGFEGMSLRDTAGQMVFGDGPASARVMFVVEAPSADDDEHGRPLSGARGALFEAMLRSIGLAREEVRVGCLIPWRPPGGRPPSPLEVGACAPFLRAHLRLLPSLELLVTMGGTVARTLGGAEGRGWRGRFFEVPVAGRAALPGLAMAGLDTIAADGKAKAAAWADLLSLRRRLDGGLVTTA